MRRVFGIFWSFFSLNGVNSIAGLQTKVYRQFGLLVFCLSSLFALAGLSDPLVTWLPGIHVLASIFNLPEEIVTRISVPSAVIAIYIAFGLMSGPRTFIADLAVGFHRILSEALITITEYLELRRNLSLALFASSSVIFGAAVFWSVQAALERTESIKSREAWSADFLEFVLQARVAEDDQPVIKSLAASWEERFFTVNERTEHNFLSQARELINRSMRDAGSQLDSLNDYRDLSDWLDSVLPDTPFPSNYDSAITFGDTTPITPLEAALRLYSLKLKQRILGSSCRPIPLVISAENQLRTLANYQNLPSKNNIDRELQNLKAGLLRCAMLLFHEDASLTTTLCRGAAHCGAEALRARIAALRSESDSPGNCDFNTKRNLNNYLDLLTQIALVDEDPLWRELRRLSVRSGDRLASRLQIGGEIEKVISNLNDCMSTPPNIGLINLTIGEAHATLVRLYHNTDIELAERHAFSAATSVMLAYRYAPTAFETFSIEAFCFIPQFPDYAQIFKTALDMHGNEILHESILERVHSECIHA